MKKKSLFKHIAELIADSLLLKYIRLKNENKKLRRRCRELYQRKMDINNRYVDLRMDTKELVSMYDKLEEQHKQLHDRFDKIIKEHSETVSNNIELKDEIHNIINENSELIENNHKLNELYIELCKSIMNGTREKTMKDIFIERD